MAVKFEVRDFSFFYGDRCVLEALNLCVRANEILSILGPANSGITTLLRCLNRLCDLDRGVRMEGDILMDGKSVFGPDVNTTALRRRVGMVFEVPTPLPMSIFDNIAYGLRVGGKASRSFISERVEYSLKKAVLWDEVKDRQNMPAMSLSGGQQQRMCIARVIALDPEVILIDRSCSGLDPISTAKFEESLVELKEHVTVVLAPHNVQQASRISDRIAFILMGSLIEEGPCEKILTEPENEKTYDYVTGRFG